MRIAMRNATIGIIAVAALGAGGLSAHADVLPSRTGPDCTPDKSKIQTQLLQLGVPLSEASNQVDQLSARDLEYYSSDPKRVQLAAGLLAEEWAIGGILVAFVGAVAITIASQ